VVENSTGNSISHQHHSTTVR